MELIDLKKERTKRRGKEIERVVASLPSVEEGGNVINVKSLPTVTPFSRPIVTPLRGVDRAYTCSA